MRELVNFCDFFVIATGTSDRQARAIAEGIEEGLISEGLDVGSSRSLKALGGLQYSQEMGLGSYWIWGMWLLIFLNPRLVSFMLLNIFGRMLLKLNTRLVLKKSNYIV